MTDFKIESVLNMNTQAVTLLCQGECTGATAVLRSAFEKLVSAMTMTSVDQDMNENASTSTIEIFPVSSSSCEHNDGQQRLSTLAHSFSPNNAFEFYSKPFNVIRPTNMSGDDDDQIQVAATVMYNLGLANQMLAITTGKSTYLERAVVHYHRALQFLDQCDTVNAATNVLLLAICNNCGYCRSYLFDAVSTRHFQEYIKFLLENTPSSNTSEELGDCCCCWEAECDYFYSSALLCGGDDTPIVPMAPAA
jgi:hypothetical protein